MKRVVWVGKVARAELAVPCPTCGAFIAQQCSENVFKGSHVERRLRAEILGFRDVDEPGELFEIAGLAGHVSHFRNAR